jgi:hypothetical protein
MTKLFLTVMSFFLLFNVFSAKVEKTTEISIWHAKVCSTLHSQMGREFLLKCYDPAASLQAIAMANGKALVTMDLDETVQDSSPAQLINALDGYNPDVYAMYIAGGFNPVPGAVNYIDAVRDAGARVVFVTARLPEERHISAEGLRKIGISCEDSDVICTSRGRNKAAVYKRLAEEYTIVAQAGDAKTDFWVGAPDAVRVVLPNLWPYGQDLTRSGLLSE